MGTTVGAIAATGIAAFASGIVCLILAAICAVLTVFLWPDTWGKSPAHCVLDTDGVAFIRSLQIRLGCGGLGSRTHPPYPRRGFARSRIHADHRPSTSG